jgi:sulfide:quinone oxidoreductase
MARVLILGGGFGGVVAAESLSKQLGDEHEITLVSRSRRFLFYPALVRLAFGQCEPDDVSFDLRKTMLGRRVNFIEAEVARVDLEGRQAILAHGEVAGRIPFDYLIFALGRRLATERVSGFFEHAYHLLDLGGALKFGEAVRNFRGGRVLIGQCPDARLPVPVYETAFALSRLIEEDGEQSNTKITIVGPGTLASELQDERIAATLRAALNKRGIQYVSDFPITTITARTVATADNKELDYNLLMLLPPFRGLSAVSHLGITSEDGYLNVDWTMKVIGAERMYAVGDCVNFDGPKMGHMAVNQAEVAAANLAAEIAGHSPVSHYEHDLMMVIEGDGDGIYFHKDLWTDEPASVRHGRFWSWAKRIHERYWEITHA